MGAGVEIYPWKGLVLDFGLGWQSLFGRAGTPDNHWFRFHAGGSLVVGTRANGVGTSRRPGRL